MSERCCLHVGGHDGVATAVHLDHERAEVRGAILLAAGGTFSVSFVNLDDAAALADELRPEAATSGVVLVDEMRDGHARLLVRHA